MKKKIFLLLLLCNALTLAFADKSRFYKNGKVIDTMYVDSEDGLKVRDYPSLKSKRICGLPHRLPVKVVAVGKEETIDGISAPWIEILVPSYEWKSGEPEYGWVFGGYVSSIQPKFKIPSNKAELLKYLTSFPYWNCGDCPAFNLHFSANGKFWCGAFEKGEPTVGTFKASDKDTVIINSAFMGIEVEVNYTVEELNICPLTEYSFKFEGPFFSYHTGSTFYGNYNHDYPYIENLHKEKCIYNNFKNSVYHFEYPYQKEYFEAELLNKFIKAGVSAAGTEYEKNYHDYWEPIMKEHQKKADAME